MRLIILLAALLVSSPAFAQGWSSYHNARFGATADIPPGFEQMGPEASNSDGLIFRSRDGSILTVFGARIPGGDFDAYMADLLAHEESYNGWQIQNRSVTPDWAQITASIGGRQMSLRVEAVCNGTIAIASKYEYSGSAPGLDRVERSLTAGAASAC